VFLGRVVVDYDVQPVTGVGLRDLFEEAEEFFVAVQRVAGVRDLTAGDLQWPAGISPMSKRRSKCST